jgi:hypothetical protein
MGRGGEESNAEERAQALPSDVEAEFGGRQARLKLEEKFLRKLDMRMSVLVLLYILNYVRTVLSGRFCYSKRMTCIDRSNQHLVSHLSCLFGFLADILPQCCSSRRV